MWEHVEPHRLAWSFEALGTLGPDLHGDLELCTQTLQCSQCSFFDKKVLSTLIVPLQCKAWAMTARGRR